MALNRQKTYMILNYNSSPLSLLTKDRSYLLEGGTREQPAVLPLTLDEINTVNSNGCAFKYGLAWFEKEFEKEIYEDLRLINWQDILRDEQIEDIILNPTKEGLEKLISIDNEIYFNRIYGIYIGLKSVFAEISPRVELVIEQRRDELSQHKRKTEIIISKPTTQPHTESFNNSEVEDLKERLAKMEELLLVQNKINPPKSEEKTKEKPSVKNKAKTK